MAGIDAIKLADGSVTNSELKYINTLSDNAQSQLDLKATLASPTFTGTVVLPNVPAIVTTQLDLKAPLASPTFTGTVVLPNVPAIVTTQLDLKAPLADPTFTGTVTTATLDVAGNNLDNIQNLIHDTSTTATTLDFAQDQLQTISISVNTTFATTGVAIGKSKTIKILNNATLHTLTFPAWKFVGAKPADIAGSKTAILTLTCFGSADADIVAGYAVEE
jgi:hypothetical protein